MKDRKTHRLCYVYGNAAYFTSMPIVGEGRQRGDDWNDAPYEHNAGLPYEREEDGHSVRIVQFETIVFESPAERAGGNSLYSVFQINAGQSAWLLPVNNDSLQSIPAGVTVPEFVRRITESGGRCWELRELTPRTREASAADADADADVSTEPGAETGPDAG